MHVEQDLRADQGPVPLRCFGVVLVSPGLAGCRIERRLRTGDLRAQRLPASMNPNGPAVFVEPNTAWVGKPWPGGGTSQHQPGENSFQHAVVFITGGPAAQQL